MSTSDGASSSQPATACRRGLTAPSRPALEAELRQQLLGALLGAVGLGLWGLLADHDLDDEVGDDARAVELGQERQHVVVGPGEADRKEAALAEAGHHEVVPRAPL